MRAASYARASTHDQQTLGLQVDAMTAYIKGRGWDLVSQVEDVGSGTKQRPAREGLLMAARRRELDAVVVRRLDRWGRSLPDLVVTLRELTELGVGFVSLTEALDLTTSTGRAMAGILAVFAEFEREVLRERVRAGIAQAGAARGAASWPPTDGVAENRRGPPAQGRACQPLGDRATAGYRPHVGAAHPGRRLTTGRPAPGPLSRQGRC
jgi:DNA invertase Pin-like site-specific DNA recombinase